jgi:hypothetical protein
MTTLEVLKTGVTRRLPKGAAEWFDRATREIPGTSRDHLLQLYTDVSRHTGHPPQPFDALEGFPPPSATGLSLTFWTIEDAVRLALLLTRSEAVAPDDFYDDAVACYELGVAREQRSWLKAVSLLPTPEQYLALVIDACRTNILPQFEAVACENPYPARFFPEPNFNQLVLKALFNGVRLERIVGLDRRANAELTRMAGDYAAERRAARRSVPVDIGLAMTGATTGMHS